MNKIEGLQDEGRRVDSLEDIERVILDYFTNIYSSDQLVSFEASLGAVKHRVTSEMNKALLNEFRAEEVRIALDQMHPTKSPRPGWYVSYFLSKILGCGWHECSK